MSAQGRPKRELPEARSAEGSPVSADATLLVELLTEELPPKALKRLGEAFADDRRRPRSASFVRERRHAVFATPRRLAVSITDVAARSPDKPFKQKLLPVSVGLRRVGQAHAGAVEEARQALGLADLRRRSSCARHRSARRQGDSVYLRGIAKGQRARARLAGGARRGHREAADPEGDELRGPRATTSTTRSSCGPRTGCRAARRRRRRRHRARLDRGPHDAGPSLPVARRHRASRPPTPTRRRSRPKAR